MNLGSNFVSKPAHFLLFSKMMTFVVYAMLWFCVLISNGIGVNGTQIVSKNPEIRASSLKNEQGRPAYHFRPPQNWLNDPNGPMYYKGVYHLFYQYYPYGATFGELIIWAHSVSHDLVNWISLNSALYPTKPFDIKSCWSGSTTILPGNKPVVLYTGLDSRNQQVQNLAMPKNLSDPFLKEWVKYSSNPIITPPHGVKPDDFRDPTTAWKGEDGNWRVVVGGLRNSLGMAIVYRSKDFVHWSLQDRPLYSGKNTGVWECPDFYPVPVNSRNGVENSVKGPNLKYVLKASFKSHDYYTIGSYNADKDRFMPDHKGFSNSSSDLRYDYGKFYASKTFFDSAKERRILWGWINESDSSADDIKKGWAGIQSVPRQVFLSTDGMQLMQWPVEETGRLRGKHVTYQDRKLKADALLKVSGITASQADVEVWFKLPNLEETEPMMDPKSSDPQVLCSSKPAKIRGQSGPFGLLVMASQDLEEQTAIFFRIFRNNQKFVVLMCSDQSRSSLRQGIDKTTYGAFLEIDPQHEVISLRSLIDHSVIESFGAGGRACITARVYPKFSVDQEAHLYAFNNGSLDVMIPRLDAWSMKKAKNN